jgi:hypothetical protein
MTSQLQSTKIDTTGYVRLPQGTTAQRPGYTAIQWTNTGSQAYSVLSGVTPTLTNTSWTAPTGVTQVEVLVVAGGGSGGTRGTNGSGLAGAGGGGAGGLIYNNAFPVVPGTVYDVSVGTGGAAVSTADTIGNNGNSSQFGSLLPNGAFDSDTIWTHTGTSIANGVLTLTSGYATPRVTNNNLGGTSGTTYTLTYTITSNPNNYTVVVDDDGAGAGVGSVTTYASNSGTGTFTTTFVRTASSRIRIIINPSTTAATVIDNVGVFPLTTSMIAIGGGGGGAYPPGSATGLSGGSGGGAGRDGTAPIYGGMSTAAGQGNKGGDYLNSIYGYPGIYTGCGGGGGAGGPGGMGGVATGQGVGAGGIGGAGLAFDISGTTSFYAGGGGGASYNGQTGASGGSGIGGRGASEAGYVAATSATASTGSGGGGGGNPSGAGSSGIVIIRYYTPTAVAGMTRYNTALGYTETYTGTQWKKLTASRVTENIATITSGIGITTSTSTHVQCVNGPYRIHTFLTGTHTFTPRRNGLVEVLVVAGGGGGGVGGGGGGGVVYKSAYPVIANTSYNVVVGRGGFPATSEGAVSYQGEGSSFATISAQGGGAGGHGAGGWTGVGGSGGGRPRDGSTTALTNGTPGQGMPGGAAGGTSCSSSGGGGGAGMKGYDGTTDCTGTVRTGTYSQGGDGLPFDISGQLRYYGGGGGGAFETTYGTSAPGGAGGGGQGSSGVHAGTNVTSGQPNTGGGGGGAQGFAGFGGSGIVIVRYINIGVPTVAQSFTQVGNSGWRCPPGVTQVEVLCVGGGGGGGSQTGGGGGGGGVVYASSYPVTPNVIYEIFVGAGGTGGGAGGGTNSTNGGNSYFDGTNTGLVAYGGGAGGNYSSNTPGVAGGSGGGDGNDTVNNGGGAGVLGQGFAGGSKTSNWYLGGGGGATQQGFDGSTTWPFGKGGDGYASAISGVAAYYGGGGGGACESSNSEGGGIGGLGGGGRGGTNGPQSQYPTAGVDGTGGGGGAARDNPGNGVAGQTGAYPGCRGGSGIVIVRWAAP